MGRWRRTRSRSRSTAGMLDVGDGHLVHWRVAGQPGRASRRSSSTAGPGAAMRRGSRMFDPARYLHRAVRPAPVRARARRRRPTPSSTCRRTRRRTSSPTSSGCASTSASSAGCVWGGSWGTLLGLVYAEAHPTRVSEMVLVSVVGSSATTSTWITRSMGRVFPAQWERFRDAVPPADRDGDLAAAYARLLQDPDPAVHGPAAAAWCEWEDTHVATVPGHTHDARYDDPAFRLCFARLVTHYWSNGCFVEDGQVLRDAHRLAGIPDRDDQRAARHQRPARRGVAAGQGAARRRARRHRRRGPRRCRRHVRRGARRHRPLRR